MKQEIWQPPPLLHFSLRLGARPCPDTEWPPTLRIRNPSWRNKESLSTSWVPERKRNIMGWRRHLQSFLLFRRERAFVSRQEQAVWWHNSRRRSKASQYFMDLATTRIRWWRRQWQPTPFLLRKIPWTEEPGGLQSVGLLRVGHDWATSLSRLILMHWRRKWQPTPVFLPGESQGRGSLVGCHLWGRTESDTTEAT